MRDPIRVSGGNQRLTIVDVRTPEEYFGPDGHLPGSHLVPLGDLSFEIARWDREAPYLVVCDDGRRSRRAVEYLEGQGFGAVCVLRGGITRWRRLKLPLERILDRCSRRGDTKLVTRLAPPEPEEPLRALLG